MKTLKKFLLTLALLPLFAFSQVKPIIIDSIAPDLYVYQTFNTYQGKEYSANSMFLVTSKGVVLFDVPWQKSQYQELIDIFKTRFKKPLIAVFATHFHEDRAGDLSFYNDKKIPTYATAKTNSYLTKEGKATSTNQIKPGKTYKFGNKSFVPQYFGEGHTPDNIFIWFPEYKVINGGCLVKSSEAQDLGNLGDANVKAWPSTIDKIIRYYPSAKFVIPGHDDWKKQEHLENTQKLLREYSENKTTQTTSH